MKKLFIALALVLAATASVAQHGHHGHHRPVHPAAVFGAGVLFGAILGAPQQIFVPQPAFIPQQQFYPPQLVARPVCAWPQEILQVDVWGNVVGRAVVCR